MSAVPTRRASLSFVRYDPLLESLHGMSVEVLSVYSQSNNLRAIASLEQLETIASFAQVRFIQPRQETLFSQTPPEAMRDFSGYNFWLGKLNQFNGNFVNAEMFISLLNHLMGNYCNV